MTKDLTTGNEMKKMLVFSLPMIAGNLLQQLYNIVDTLIVGKILGANALAAVGSSYAIMVFLTSVNLGFCMGSGVVFARFFGAKDEYSFKTSIVNAFVFIGLLTALLNVLAFILVEPILSLLNIQDLVWADTKTYLQIIFTGLMFTFLYNFFAAVLRSIGNSMMPLIFLAFAAVLNILLDIVFVMVFRWGIGGAAWATIFSQAVSALLVTGYCLIKAKEIRPGKQHMVFHGPLLKIVISNSVLSSIQQSIMNFGILMVQGLINSFGVPVMAAFAAAVKIDTFAYMPIQDFGNAFSTYVAQNYGAGKMDRIRSGVRIAVKMVVPACIFISFLVVVFAGPLMSIFIDAKELEIISIGVRYLRVEGVFYVLIGCLFLLYGFYRGLGRAEMSVILTVISLGSRVFLSYTLAPIASIGLMGIWCSIPIGWFLADTFGILYYWKNKKKLLPDYERKGGADR